MLSMSEPADLLPLLPDLPADLSSCKLTTTSTLSVIDLKRPPPDLLEENINNRPPPISTNATAPPAINSFWFGPPAVVFRLLDFDLLLDALLLRRRAGASYSGSGSSHSSEKSLASSSGMRTGASHWRHLTFLPALSSLTL